MNDSSHLIDTVENDLALIKRKKRDAVLIAGLVAALGGQVDVAVLLGVGPASVKQYASHGLIPARHFRPLRDAARKIGLDVEEDWFSWSGGSSDA